MVYKVVSAFIHNDGSVTEGTRKQTISWPADLNVGGLYFLRKGKLYRIVEKFNIEGGD